MTDITTYIVLAVLLWVFIFLSGVEDSWRDAGDAALWATIVFIPMTIFLSAGLWAFLGLVWIVGSLWT